MARILISTLVYVCDHVLSDERPIGIVVHHSDNEWQLTCGKNDHNKDGASIRPVHAEHLFQGRPFLQNLMETLDRGWLAEWSGGRWERSAHDD
jgi:hypothetical protein